MLPLISICRSWRPSMAIASAAVCALCLTCWLFIRKRPIKGADAPKTVPLFFTHKQHHMYPSFVTVTTRNQRGIRILTICGQEYKAYPYDRYIDDAIALAGHWLAHQVTYERI